MIVAKDLDENKIVGVAVGTFLSSETEIVHQAGEQLQQYGIVPERFYYFGEMIFEPEYRNRGIGKRMLEMLKTPVVNREPTGFASSPSPGRRTTFVVRSGMSIPR